MTARNPTGSSEWFAAELGPHARQDEETQHVLGFAVDWYGPVDGVWLRSLKHPIKAYKRWTLIRRLGPYAPDDEDDL